MKKLLCFGVVLLCSVISQTSSYHIIEARSSVTVGEEKDWWETASFYQIYPRSFKDSNGDGIGDLNGITDKLPYLKDLGIQAAWLSPIFKSPMADFGYDISDFFDIQEEYGTMDDFKALISKAKELGIKIILDFVPNHSSDENNWFTKSANKVKGFEDFYVWHPGYPDPNNSSSRLPPSNWISFFWHSAWQWNDNRQEFYLHQFHRKQPDLNYRNPNVVKTMKSVLEFWLDKGVDGFRIDAVPTIFEIKPDQNNRYLDEPLSGWTNDTEDPAYLLHTYTQDQDETMDMVYQWREVLDEYKKLHGGETRVMMTESYSKIDIVMKYYGDGVSREGSEVPFNFYWIMNLNQNSNARDVENTINLWLKNMPKNRTPNWVLGNHDQKRVASRFGEDHIDMLNMLILTLPGISVTYNGEEIGMSDVWISWNDTVDPAACNTNPSVYERYSRDPERTPFQWDSSVSAGFSTNPKTWLPVSSNFKEVNVEAELASENSHLKIYKALIKLRQSLTLQYGEVAVRTFNDNVIAVKRDLAGSKSYITIANFGSNQETVDLTIFGNIANRLTYTIVNVGSQQRVDDTVNANNIVLQAKESFVLESVSGGAGYFQYLWNLDHVSLDF